MYFKSIHEKDKLLSGFIFFLRDPRYSLVFYLFIFIISKIIMRATNMPMPRGLRTGK